MDQNTAGDSVESKNSSGHGRRRRRRKSAGKGSARSRARQIKKIVFTVLFVLVGGAVTVALALRLGTSD